MTTVLKELCKNNLQQPFQECQGRWKRMKKKHEESAHLYDNLFITSSLMHTKYYIYLPAREASLGSLVLHWAYSQAQAPQSSNRRQVYGVSFTCSLSPLTRQRCVFHTRAFSVIRNDRPSTHSWNQTTVRPYIQCSSSPAIALYVVLLHWLQDHLLLRRIP